VYTILFSNGVAAFFFLIGRWLFVKEDTEIPPPFPFELPPLFAVFPLSSVKPLSSDKG